MPLIKVRCQECKGFNVQSDAYATWDFEAQAWDVQGTHDKDSWCDDCECRIEDINVPTREELLEMLDNLSATARNMLGGASVHRGEGVTVEQWNKRHKLISEARAVCDAELRPTENES